MTKRGGPRRNRPFSLMLVGRLDEARKLIEEYLERSDWTMVGDLATLAELAAREGRPEEVLRLSRVADTIPFPEGGEPKARNSFPKARDSFHRAKIAAALGDGERAMTFLRESAEELSLPIHTRHHFEFLWDYPPFQEYLRITEGVVAADDGRR